MSTRRMFCRLFFDFMIKHVLLNIMLFFFALYNLYFKKHDFGEKT